jgi:hypothetical protein
MATILKRPEGTYRAQIRRKGYKPISAAFAKRQDAVDWAQKTEAALIERRFFPEREKHTLSEAIARYLKENLPAYKPGTAEKKRQVLSWWDKRLGSIALTALNSTMILDELLKSEFAPATHNAYVAHLTVVCSEAVRKWEWMQKFPHIKHLHVPKYLDTIFLHETRVVSGTINVIV